VAEDAGPAAPATDLVPNPVQLLQQALAQAVAALGGQMVVAAGDSYRCDIWLELAGSRLGVTVWDPAGSWQPSTNLAGDCLLCGQSVGPSHECSKLGGSQVILGGHSGLWDTSVDFPGQQSRPVLLAPAPEAPRPGFWRRTALRLSRR
jgi:hypothetical protein